MNKVEKLLKRCEEKINKPWYYCWINWNCLCYGFRGKHGEIRKMFLDDIKDLDKKKVETFIKICNSKIDRIKSHSRDIVTAITVSAASFTIACSILIEKIIKATEAN